MEKEKVTAINMKCPQISVIVPVYKVEPYLRCCIDSILTQTFTDFELILVDDGSPDHCGAVCDEYAARDSRITVIHQENQGVSAARNAALDWVFANSNSAWITFVDSDDAIVPEYLEILMKFALETNADVVTTNARCFVENAELMSFSSMVDSCRIMNGRDACLSFYRDEGVVLASPWGRLCRKELLRELRFPLGIAYAEDRHLVVRLLYNANAIAVLAAQLYGYRMRDGSAVHQTFSNWVFDHARVLDDCMSYFKEHNEKEIVTLIDKQRIEICAKNVLLAYGAGRAEAVPEEYRMPVWRASYIVLSDTLRRGGLKQILTRVRMFMKRIKG